jgi:hypothetical protein
MKGKPVCGPTVHIIRKRGEVETTNPFWCADGKYSSHSSVAPREAGSSWNSLPLPSVLYPTEEKKRKEKEKEKEEKRGKNRYRCLKI